MSSSICQDTDQSELLVIILKSDVLMITQGMIFSNRMEICWKLLKIIYTDISVLHYNMFSQSGHL